MSHRASHRAARRPAILVVAFLMAACSAAPAAPGTNDHTGGTGASSPASSETANLPDLNLANVRTETANARGAAIGAAGGTVTATASDGATFSLAVPAHALDKTTLVALYPVSSVTGLPSGESLSAAVQFAPDGTHLLVPATLTITLPAGADTSNLGASSWSGDATGIHPTPVALSGNTATLRIYHFSGAGVGQVPLVPISTCFTASDLGSLVARDVGLGVTHDPDARTAFTNDLKTCWADYVSPVMAVASKESAFDNLDDEEAAVDAYQLWRDGAIYWAGGFFPGFTVSPEMTDSQQLAAKLLRNWFDTFNLECIGVADQPRIALLDATLALDTPHEKAGEWGIDSRANKLDYQSLLDDLCVQIVIDPSRSFSASRPADSGTVTVPVGYSVVGQPVQHDEPIDVQLTLTGQAVPFADDDAPSDGKFTAPLTWPDGVDPLKIDVLASFDFDGNLSEIARFDRITKTQHSKIAFSARATNATPNWSIYAMEDNGQSVVRLTTGPSNDLGPRWSPDGTRIVFARNRSIYTMAADGSDLQQLTSGFLDEVPAWSPDGTRIAFERRQIGSAEPGPGESFIDVMDADGSHVVDTGVVAAESAKLSWSPDSARIAYTQLYVNGSDVREGIGVMNADGSGVATLAGSPSAGKLQGGSPAWSPAGATIAFGCFGSGIPGGLCLVSSSGGSPEQLLRQTCASPSWSPDNLSIACIGDDQAIHVFNLNSGNVQSVGAGGSAAAAQPDWGQ